MTLIEIPRPLERGRDGARPAWRNAAMLALLLLLGTLALVLRPGKLIVDTGDSAQYLDAAYHLRHHGSFSEAAVPEAVSPALGREPGYAVFLAGLMALDPVFDRYGPACLTDRAGCDPAIYRAVGIGNLLLVLLSGVALFLLAHLLAGRTAGLVAAGYLLLNFQMNQGWRDPVSDRLAVFLVATALLAAAWAWRGRVAWRWVLVGLPLAALTLTKAVFLPYVGLAAGSALLVVVVRPALGRRILPALALMLVVYALCVGGWMARNREVSGEFRLTDARGGIALSTREVFDDMSPAQYLAAFAYWTRGPGAGLARRLFPAAVVAPFDLDRPGGFYDRGQNGYAQRVDAMMAGRRLDRLGASHAVDREIIAAILAQPFTHLATTLPLFYRGIWCDEFIVLGLPLFMLALVRAARQRDALLLVLLSAGAFNLLFYAAFSLNIPRYQMTAVPEIALAAGLAAARWRRSGEGA